MRLNEYRKLRQMPNNLSNFRIQDAANYLGVSSKTLRRWGQSGKLVSKRSEGGHRYYTREQLDNFRFADKTETAVSPSPLKNKDYTLALSFTVIMLCIGLTGLDGRGSFDVNSENNTSYNKQQATNNKGQHPSVLAASDEGITPSVAGFTFAVNVPSKFSETVTFLKDIVAPNVVNSINNEVGDITIDNSLVAGTGISITDRTISNSGIVTLSAGTGISVDGNKITNTYSFTPDYTQSGWTRTGTTVGLTTLTDSVTVGALTAGAVTVDSLTTGGLSLTSDLTVSSGHSLLPSTDLGSDIGSSSFRFNNLWVANINSNSSQAFSGQTTFSYPPTDTTIDQASVLINPTTSVANGQLLGLGIAGYERAVIDEDGDIILGYNSLTSPPATDYPLDIYGHSGTRVAYVDTSGYSKFSGITLPAGGALSYSSLAGFSPYVGTGDFYMKGYKSGYIFIDTDNNSSDQAFIVAKDSHEAGLHTELFRVQENGNVGIGTTAPSTSLSIYNSNSSATVADFTGGLTKAGINISTNYVAGNYTPGIFWSTSDNNSTKPKAGIYTRTTASGTAMYLGTSGAYATGINRNFTIDEFGKIDSFQVTTGFIMSSANTGTNNFKLYGGGAGGVTIQAGYAGNGGDILLQTSSGSNNAYNNSFVLTQTGNIGIGTTSPTSKLHVSGAVTGKALAIFDETGDQNILTASASGTTRFVVTNSGNVGIGTTSPGAKLHVSGGSILLDNGYALNIKDSGGSARDIVRFGANNILQIGSTASTISDLYLNTKDVNGGIILKATTGNVLIPSGNVGIGTTSPGYALDVNGTTKASTFLSTGGFSLSNTGLSIGGSFVMSNMANTFGNMKLVSSSTGLGVNLIFNTPADTLSVRNLANTGDASLTAGSITSSSLTTGTVYSNAGVLTNTDPSDVNLKTNILNLPDGTLDKVLGLRTVSYDWKSTGDGALGFVAQEVQRVFPELVGTNSDGTLGLYTTQFIPLLTKAIQEQQLQIDEVKLSSSSATITNEEWNGVNSLITTIQNAINEIQQKFVAMTDKFRTKELCVGENGNETCVTKEQLDELLKLVPTPSTAPVITPSPESSPEATVVPTVSPTSVPTVEPSPTSSPSAEPIL